MNDNMGDANSLIDELSRAGKRDTRPESHTLSINTTGSNKSDAEQELDELMEQVIRALPTDDHQFNEEIIKENLEEVLLMLIALHGETHGKELLSELTQLFNVQLSPGTVYPSLHDLEEKELLKMHAMVRTKEYSIENEGDVRTIIEHTMVQHLAFGLLLYTFLSEFSPTI